MLLLAVSIIVVAYLLVCVVAYLVARISIEDKSLRMLFVLFAFLVPPVGVWAFIRTLLGRPKHAWYSEELARIEDEIEQERTAIFGGKPVSPSFSERWKLGYLREVGKAANKVESLMGSHHVGGVSIFAK